LCRDVGKQANKLVATAQLQRLHQSLHRRRTSTLRRIASARRRKIRAILSNGDVHDAAAYRASMVPTGSGGKSNLFSSGRLSVPFAATKGTRNCTELFGNVHTSMLCGSVTRWLPQSLRDSSLPEGAHVHSDAAGRYRLRGTPTVIRQGGCNLPQGGRLCAH